MAENPLRGGMEDIPRANDENTAPSSENYGRSHPRRSHRKRSDSMDALPSFSPPRKPLSRKSSSMSSTSSIRKHRKRSHRRRTHSTTSERSAPVNPSAPPAAKKLATVGRKSIAALSGLAGLLVGVVPVAGELYLKHKEHQHDREREERKEARYGQAMEAREQKKMDLELQALEEEKAFQREKHRLELLEMQTELQKKIPKRKEVRWEDQQQDSRPSLGTRVMCSNEEQARDESQVRGFSAAQQSRTLLEEGTLDRRTRSPTPTNRDLDIYIPPPNSHLPPGPTGAGMLLPPRRRRSKRPSRDISIPVSKQAIHAGGVGLIAGAATAVRLRESNRPWVGERGMRIGASAATAAVASVCVQNGERYEDRHRLRDVALPVIAGIGVERILWDE